MSVSWGVVHLHEWPFEPRRRTSKLTSAPTYRRWRLELELLLGVAREDFRWGSSLRSILPNRY